MPLVRADGGAVNKGKEIDFGQRLESYRNKLLDMSMMNPLLNYRDTASSTLRIDAPDMGVLWKMFVDADGAGLTFPLAKAASAGTSGTGQDGDPGGDESSVDNPDGVVTDKGQSDMARSLRRLSALSKSTIEEQGINSLFIAFGLLGWREESLDGSPMGDVHYAPLLLVPATLSRETIRSPYVLGRHEDEVEANQTLAHRLKEYGFDLPAFGDGEEAESYLARVERACAGHGWKVVRTVVLARFSYQKMSMFNDLARKAAQVVANPVFRSICGDGSTLEGMPAGFDDYDYDERGQEDLLQVVDADSSQLDAMRLAQAGVSFVMQGPPGTGKSQTITNLIADALGHGKTVLFVSEKKAALDVVYQRLARAGLSDFCLVLHGTRSQSRGVNAQLAKSVELCGKSASLGREAAENLEGLKADRAVLTAYAKAVFEPTGALERAPYDAAGEISKLADVPDIAFTAEFDVKAMTRSELAAAVEAADSLSVAAGRIAGGPSSSPFRGMSAGLIRRWRPELTHRLEALEAAARRACGAVEGLGLAIGARPIVRSCDLGKLKHLVELQRARPDVPSEWPLDVVAGAVTDLAAEGQRVSTAIAKATKSARLSALQAAKRGVGLAPLPLVEAALDSRSSEESRSKLERELTSTEPFSSMYAYGRKRVPELSSQLMSLLQRWQDVDGQINARCDPGIRDVDARALRDRFRNDYASFFSRLFSGTYRPDLAAVRSHVKDASKQFKQPEALAVLELLCDRLDVEDEIHGIAPRCQQAFGGLFAGSGTDAALLLQSTCAFNDACACLDSLAELRDAYASLESVSPELEAEFGGMFLAERTDWEAAFDVIGWAADYRSCVEDMGASVDDVWVRALSDMDARDSALSDAEEAIGRADEGLALPLQEWAELFEEPDAATGAEIGELARAAEAYLMSPAELENWLDYCDRKAVAEGAGIGGFVRAAEEEGLPTERYADAIKKSLLSDWLEAACKSSDVLARFSEDGFERTQRRFAQEERRRFDVAKKQVFASLVQGLPTMQGVGPNDERAVLSRELKKQRRLLPPRRLFNEIPHLLLKLKPCLMMSPLSVSMYLESDEFSFDLVVFDEASQVRTQDAIGSICRGRQVVIAGDSRQLPPTSFFDAVNVDSSEEGSDDYYQASESFDSVLDEAFQLPQVMLKWHYRSREEGLITFSNRRFYENGLVTFPSDRQGGSDWGVEFVHVPDGVYEGSRKGNRVEAERIADLVEEHVCKYGKKRSLGVIAFSQNQQEIIENALQRRAMDDVRLENLLADDGQTPFFVKNLENVQGDERDTIILGVGYGKDKDGNLRLNFGPLNKEGGERRLNVAVTRAMRNLKVVASILPADIAARNAKTSGPLLLHDYLEYAKVGSAALAVDNPLDTELVFDSPFEESVYEFLTSKGFEVATQVGSSGYRIDLAVRDPQDRGHFVCGIECDGASYHSGRTARERDRLRQEVLEGMGWRFVRIWSTEWFRRPAAAREELLGKVRDALRDSGREPRPEAQADCGEDAPSAGEGLLRITERKEAGGAGLADFEAACAAFVESARAIRSSARFAEEAVFALGPICEDTILKLHKERFGSRITKSVKEDVEGALRRLERLGKATVKREGDLAFYKKARSKLPARTAGTRGIDEISLDELAACFGVVDSQPLLMDRSKEAMIDELSRALGFKRKGPRIVARLEKAYDLFLRKRK